KFMLGGVQAGKYWASPPILEIFDFGLSVSVGCISPRIFRLTIEEGLYDCGRA
ncbi:hypothetical protein HBH89_250870, partial [Parastagonospora nodorum]